MGTVKYSGPIASFHCPTEATIRSLKVHFSPKQEGSGTPSPENVREIVGWDGVVVHNDDGNVLPEEYQKVEYLESNGKQYLYTNIPIQTPFTVEADFMYHSDLDQCLICAGYNQDGRTVRVGALGKYKSNLQNYYAGYWNAMSISNNIRYKMRVQEKEGLQVTENNGVEVNRQTQSHNSSDIPLDKTKGNFAIFCMCRNGEFVYYCYAKLYSMTIWGETGTIVGKFIPCRRKSDNKPGMYDTVSGEFFTNQGTGEFICGPDVGETVEYEFGVLGKNKFDYANANIIDAKRRDDNGNEVADGSGSYSSALTPVSPSTTYTASGFGTNLSKRVYYIGADENFLSRSDIISNNTFTFTTPSNCHYIQFQSGRVDNSTWSEVQLELGSTATAYEPYDPNHTVYGGWVDLISGEVCEDGIDGYPYCPIVLKGTEEWTLVKQDDEASIFKYYYGVNAKTESKSICSHFQMILPSYTSLSCHNGFVHGMSGNLFIQPTTSTASTVEEFKSYLASQYHNGTPVTILFQANKAPNTYQLAPTSMQTFLSTNNVWSNADYVEIEYDLHETQDILARKQFIIANQPHTVKASGSLVNFETDMAAKLKECKVHFGPVQEGEGDPSPDNVRAITGWTGVEVTRCGKNLCDAATGTEMVEKWPSQSGSSSREKSYPHFPTGQSFTLSCRWTKAWETSPNRRLYFNGDKQAGSFIAPANDGPVSKSITNTPSTTDARCLWISHNNRGLTYDGLDGQEYAASLVDVQLEIGSAATEFESYQGQMLAIDWTSEAGTVYGGYVDLVTGEVWKTYNKIILDGDNIQVNNGSYESNGNYGAGLVYVEPIGKSARYKNGLPINLWSENIPLYIGVNTLPEPPYVYAPLAGKLYFVVYVAKVADHPELADKTARKNYVNEWLKQNPITLVYELETPTVVTTLTPTQLKSLRGTNNIWASNNGDNIEIAYWKH